MSESGSIYWRRNLAVCMIGAFSTTLGLTIMLPFLPLFVEQLGVTGHDAIVQWSGIAFSGTFLSAGLIAPLWGRLGDRFGRKAMLIRASLGLSVVICLLGFATNIYTLIVLLLLVGLAGGYGSGATILIAVQAPDKRSGWALGMIASSVMAGNLVGPLLGGWLPPLIGIPRTFWSAGVIIFVAFLLTWLFIVEDKKSTSKTKQKTSGGFGSFQGKSAVVYMLITGMFLMVANVSIEPIITVFISSIEHDQSHITQTAGMVMSAAALGSVLSASWLGKLADHIGHVRVIILGMIAAGVLLIPQAYVTAGWQLIVLRFLMGIALGGLLPCTSVVIKKIVPVEIIGLVMGYSVSAKFIGQFLGPFLGGIIGGNLGIQYVFIITSILMFIGAGFNMYVASKAKQRVYDCQK